jgi:hypothetical protein
MGDVVCSGTGRPGRRVRRGVPARGRLAYIPRTMKEEPRDQRPKLRLTQLSHGAG